MNRRQLLRTCGAFAAVGTAGLAGCGSLSDVPVVGGEIAGDFGDIGRWMPDPGGFDPSLDHYRVFAQSPARLAEVSDDALWDIVASSSIGFDNLTASQVEQVIGADVSTDAQRSFRVYTGSFDPDWIGTTLERRDFGQSLSYEGLRVYEPTGDGNRAYAVDSETILRASHQPADPSEDADPTGVVRTLVDANRGEVERYAGVNQDMEALSETVPVEHRVSVRTFDRVTRSSPEEGAFRNQVAQGTSHAVDGEETDVTRVLVFRDERDVVEREIVTYIEESQQFATHLERPEYRLSGRTVVIEGTVATQALSLGGIGQGTN